MQSLMLGSMKIEVLKESGTKGIPQLNVKFQAYFVSLPPKQDILEERGLVVVIGPEGGKAVAHLEHEHPQGPPSMKRETLCNISRLPFD